ncbi:hypothetical protein Dimus_006596 [Dionaea muscipula]
MMSSIANWKENLNKIAHDVHGDDGEGEELPINGLPNGHSSPYSDRRLSHSLAHSRSGPASPVSNGISPSHNSEIEQYKREIRRLKESEAEIKALSINYAALLKEKEDQIARLNQEYGSLRQNLDTAKVSSNDTLRGSTTSSNWLKVIGDQSPSRQHKLAAQGKNRSTGNQLHNGVATKLEGYSNGFAHTIQPDVELNYVNSMSNQKDLADLLEEKSRLIADIQANHELQFNQLRTELQKEQEKSTIVKLKLQEEEKIRQSLQEDLNSLKSEHDRTSVEISKLRSELNDKGLQIRKLQMELDRKVDEVDGVEGLKRVIATLEEEKHKLQKEKEELEAAVKARMTSATASANSYPQADSLGSSAGKDELEKSLHKFEKDLKETRHQRDKALQELARLKQHLLDKESEESEKMDEDSKIIEELRQNAEHQKARIVSLERSLQQAYANQEEIKSTNVSELQKSKEIIEDLKEKLGGCVRVIDAKNVELLNLQTALGQYYAEIEAKERIEGDLSVAREDCAKLSQLLKVSNQQVEETRREKEEISSKLAQLEGALVEAKNRVIKIEDDNAKLRRALEQSRTRLTRMSVDSDFLVDRRIVIKLLVTYFQRNHSKEVLDLMVRMLGFSDEDKQRIGAAQQGAGKGVVRGVLGFPGRLVGGILSGSSPGAQTNSAFENQSFADLWVDFLVKESEERERRESMQAAGRSDGDPRATSPTMDAPPSVPDNKTSEIGRPGGFLSIARPPLNTSRSPYDHSSLQQYEQTGSEFSTVPLTPSETSPWSSKQIPKY